MIQQGLIWLGEDLYIIVWFGIIQYDSAYMLENVDSMIWQNAGVLIWQKAVATIWQNAGNFMISYCVVQYDLVRLDIVW